MKSRILAALAFALCLLNLWRSIHDVQKYGGTDLRVRVVGARALVRGINPYTIQQTDSLDPELQDPDQKGLNRCTYPPTLLGFYAPLSSLPWRSQRIIWAVLEWCAFAGSVLVLSACVKSRDVRFWFFVAAVGLFGSSFFWRLHVERGQYYVFVVLLISVGMLLIIKTRKTVLAGIFWGVAICVRPTVGLLVLPWLMSSQRRIAIAAMTTAIVAVAAVTVTGEPEYWRDFLKLSQAWEQIVLGAESPGATSEAAASGPTDGYVPAMLQSYAANLTFDSLALSVQTMLNVRIDPGIVARVGKLVWLIVIAAIWILQGKRKTDQSNQVEEQLLVGCCLMLLTDYFLPIRVEYSDVLFLIPLALLMPVMLQKEFRLMAVLFVVAMLIPLTPIDRLPFNVASPVAMLRSAIVMYLVVRFTVTGLRSDASEKAIAQN